MPRVVLALATTRCHEANLNIEKPCVLVTRGRGAAGRTGRLLMWRMILGPGAWTSYMRQEAIAPVRR